MQKLHVFLEPTEEMEEVVFSPSLTGFCFKLSGWYKSSMRNLSWVCPSWGSIWGAGYIVSFCFPTHLALRFYSAWTYREVHSHPDPVPYMHPHICRVSLYPTLRPAEEESPFHPMLVLWSCGTNNPNRNVFSYYSGVQKSEIHMLAGPNCPWRVKGRILSCFSWLRVSPGVPWLVAAELQSLLCPHMAFSSTSAFLLQGCLS